MLRAEFNPKPYARGARCSTSSIPSSRSNRSTFARSQLLTNDLLVDLSVAPILQLVDQFAQFAPLRVELRISIRIVPDERAAQRVLTFEYESLTFASWNQMAGWLRQLEGLRGAA